MVTPSPAHRLRITRAYVRAWARHVAGTVLLVALACLSAPSAMATDFATDQNASLQLGSASFTSTNRGPNMARGLDRPYGVQLDSAGRVLIGDFGNGRVAIYNSLPATNGAPIDRFQRNDPNDYRGVCNSTYGRHVSGAWSGGGRLAVAEAVESSVSKWNSRVMLYDAMPTGTAAAANRVLGQPNMTTCGATGTTASSLKNPAAVWTNGTKVIVSDRDNNRVLIWNTWPTVDGQPADLVLGQANMTSSVLDDGVETASTLDHPNGVWSDGTRIAVADTFNNRVLIWTSWPTTNAQAANLVLGQAAMTTDNNGCTATTMYAPKGVASDGTKLAITDGGNFRAVLYDSFPAVSGAAAVRVLGQASLTTCAGRNAGATTALGPTSFALPYGITTDGTRLLIADRLNHRVLGWSSWPTTDNQAADRVIGHTTFTAAGPNDIGLNNHVHWSYYMGVSTADLDNPMEPANHGTWPAVTPDGRLLISDGAGSRLDVFAAAPAVHDAPPTMRFGQYADDQAFCNGTDDVLRAETLCYPMGVWTNGVKLVVVDSGNNRVKIWNTYPTTRNQPPDLVLGQATWSTRVPGVSASALDGPGGVASDGTRLVVSDTDNNRVLIWNTWPTASNQAADLVLGQPDFVSSAVNNGGRSAQTFNEPIGVSIWNGKLAVADQTNNRILIWSTFPTIQRQAADTVYGQANFTAAAITNIDEPKGIALSDNALVFTTDCAAMVMDPIPTGIVASGARSIGRGCWTQTPSAMNVWEPTGIAVRNGSVWVANDGNARMSRFDDITAPVLEKGPATSQRDGCANSVRITWRTSESTTTELYWGTSSSATVAGYASSFIDPSFTGLMHARTLSSLGAGTWYYRVRAVDAAGNERISPERSFTVGAAVPANDLFASSSVLAPAGGSFAGTNAAACLEAGEPTHAGVTSGSSVWYSWTAPSNGRFVLDTLGSGIDTTLSVYTGAAVGALTPVASNDDAGGGTVQSRVAVNVVSGTTYRIAVDGWYGDSGPFSLSIRLIANDAFAQAQTMTGTLDTEVGSNVGATKEAGEPNHAGNVGGASVWYTWTAPTTGTVSVDTFGSSFDTLLGAYTGTAVNALTMVANNDDTAPGYTSRITFTATMGTTYRFAVDGWGADSGDVTIHLVLTPTITAATASSAPQGRRSLAVQLTGTGFTSTTTVSFSGAGLTVSAPTYVSPTRIDVTVTVAASAPLGARDITVANPNTATGTGLFTITPPAITIGMSTLGYTDPARAGTGPYSMDFGTLVPGGTREIGPASSGQTLAGPAVRMTVTSDTDSEMFVSATAWTAGAATMPVSQMSWKHFGVTEAWTPMTTGAVRIDGPRIPGTAVHEHDLRIDVPAVQPPGAYSASIAYSVVAAP
ncbi:MAG: hypothetical protein JWM86_1048 [Thermoleophilia bacterium]|nr:hypothetical protein [Thermoleophilia bacterium]